MPKKKLTKTQVKRRLTTAKKALYFLFLDKFQYGSNSNVPLSQKVVFKLTDDLTKAVNRIK